ncbi:MAG: hypothetical protein CL840_21145 [Crocinitomicaceae bacterium]|nr:hypothetical protein [Crocinitomicaceae bacterium]|tara:strand:- start:731 stop:1510 length:780 start_codon:yes stop_codon:yes gene_type:complete
MERNEKPISVQKEELKFPVIIDTFNFKTSKRKAAWLSTANHELLYIGKWKDTIYPDYRLKYYPIAPPPPPAANKFDPSDTTAYSKILTEHKMYPYYINWMALHNHISWHEAKISITIDTTQRVKNDDIHVNWDEPFFEAYPVLIENMEDDTITIAYGSFVPLITEAKDSTGNWRPIEKKWMYACGNGVGTFILPPNEIALSATMIYHGNYSTTLRLKIDSTFSNEFKGNINYRQFESKFNEQGGYKEEYKREIKNDTKQ